MKQVVVATVLTVVCLRMSLLHADEPALVSGKRVFADILQPVFRQSCVKCHGKNDKAEGKVNLFELKSGDDLMAKPALVKDLIEVLDAGDMPPEDEPELAPGTRKILVTRLRELLRVAVASQKAVPRTPIRRMNR
ncbi:MAG: hypothetical protein IH991_08750, partial [Planctomycetes bacterium]|nr:hypothetical protein [Planctomycetota bacterium]